jgi:hypothetical protein
MNEAKRIAIEGSVQGGLDQVKSSVHAGRPLAWVGPGALGGFALIVGAVGPGVVQLGNGGCIVALPLSPLGLRALVDRGLTLLGEKPSTPPLPEGLVIG